ncbi:TPA: LexA family protein [Legionella pneumophila]|uniref:LexA family protein n=1 Tax=Legionella pneumophila TaxID=446 RepID=UPI00077714D1|nr:XRE family transcriptional regulator [Legionella pneumophila]HAU0830363.1 helix-turn-helix domain-containing protein [Legionella pneumophila]HBD7058687.1 helix-turn-helix domain-containing protein [Legionella pneumophila]HCQ3573320.1 helix-turn-helix domain-containing protein [Legionella pneumophila]HEM7040265.1 helix-turn-helix domain-containing protein [Legionella pneumophila]HEO1425845.1 helix-turn-helix domain-containing protein [Legionella pneumophila]
MSIREKIGKRINEARKAKGLTRQALADLTDDIKPSRINNWEHGTRMPGPAEITQLAKALDVSPAFLMGFSDERDGEFGRKLGIRTLIPLLDYEQACDPNYHIQRIKEEPYANKITFIPVSPDLANRMDDNAFALRMIDDSMSPEIRVNDIQIVDPSIFPNPGDFVVVKISGKNDVIICQYKKLSYTSPEFELLTLNDNWPNITFNESEQVEIVGPVIQIIRTYRQ